MLFDECYAKCRKGGFETTTGMSKVHKTKAPEYTQGYCWRYMSRRKGECVSCSSTTLMGLIEKCASKDIPVYVVDSEKARRTCESEGIDYDMLLQNKLVVL